MAGAAMTWWLWVLGSLVAAPLIAAGYVILCGLIGAVRESGKGYDCDDDSQWGEY